MIKLTALLLEILNEASIEQLQQIFVDKNLISSEDFEMIKKASKNKGAYATWLSKKVVDEIISVEDISKYEKYFEIFDKYKDKFPYKDINQYKTQADVSSFEQTAIELVDYLSSIGGDDTKSNKNLVSLKGIEELKQVGISLIGIVDGYQCFKVPRDLYDDRNAWTIYRKWLARCSGRDEEDEEGNKKGKIEICTMGGFNHFQSYLSRGNFYVFFNMADSKSPYQFAYESSEFMDKNDTPLI
jgi:hypothetical protein